MMKRFFTVIFLILNCGAVFATIVVPTDYIQVMPTNAMDHGVLFQYGSRAGDVFVQMPYTKGDLPFYEAVLECTNSARHFHIPLGSIHPMKTENTQDVIWIAFFMDRQTLRDCSLTITFRKDLEKATDYILSLKDFIPKEEASPNK